MLFHLVNHIFKELQIVVPVIYNQVKALHASVPSSMNCLSYQFNVPYPFAEENTAVLAKI